MFPNTVDIHSGVSGHVEMVAVKPIVVPITNRKNVGCPFIGRTFDDNWGLEDLTGKSDEEFKLVIGQIEKKILEL